MNFRPFLLASAFALLGSIAKGDQPTDDIAAQPRDLPTKVRSWTLADGESMLGQISKWDEASGRVTFKRRVSDFEQEAEVSKTEHIYQLADFSKRDQEHLNRHLTGIVKGKVISITDGDTLTILTEAHDQMRIRLHGVDSPEAAQAFNKKAKQKLSEMVGGKDVVVHLRKGKIWERFIGTIYDKTGRNVNLEMIKSGFAWHSTKFLPDNELYAEAENQAQVEKSGLWYDQNPMAPWEYRDGKKDFKAPDQLVAEGKKVRVMEPRFAQLREKVLTGDASAASFEHRAGLTKKLSPEMWKTGVKPKFWLTENSKIRHNELCDIFENSKGRLCDPNEGRACKKCGG